MPRKSERLSSGTATKPKHKRAASGTLQSSSKAKRSKETPTKSQYFDDPETGSGQPPADDWDEGESSSGDDEGSDFEGDEVDLPSEPEDDDADDSESDEAPKKRNKSTPAKKGASTAAIRTKGEDLLRPGVKAGLGPGTEVVIKKPKARS